jgi:hypothetical protein
MTNEEYRASIEAAMRITIEEGNENLPEPIYIHQATEAAQQAAQSRWKPAEGWMTGEDVYALVEAKWPAGSNGRTMVRLRGWVGDGFDEVMDAFAKSAGASLNRKIDWRLSGDNAEFFVHEEEVKEEVVPTVAPTELHEFTYTVYEDFGVAPEEIQRAIDKQRRGKHAITVPSYDSIKYAEFMEPMTFTHTLLLKKTIEDLNDWLEFNCGQRFEVRTHKGLTRIAFEDEDDKYLTMLKWK